MRAIRTQNWFVRIIQPEKVVGDGNDEASQRLRSIHSTFLGYEGIFYTATIFLENFDR